MKWLKLNDVILTLMRRKNDWHRLLSEESKFQNKVDLCVPSYIKNKSYICTQMHRQMSGSRDRGRDSAKKISGLTSLNYL